MNFNPESFNSFEFLFISVFQTMGKHKSKRSRRRDSRDSSPEDGSSAGHSKGMKSGYQEETNLAHFSFLDHKTELNRVLQGYSYKDQLVEEPSDFWLFLQKYEALLKKSGSGILPEVKEDLDKLPKGFPTEFNKIHLNNLRFAIPVEEILNRTGSNDKLGRKRILQFLQIVLQYLDFRQKEKFNKLKKLRKTQANLPVAKFKDEIVAAVKNERVVLLAGDTGCGKSTQIPQYLYQAGFKSIGKESGI